MSGSGADFLRGSVSSRTLLPVVRLADGDHGMLLLAHLGGANDVFAHLEDFSNC